MPRRRSRSSGRTPVLVRPNPELQPVSHSTDTEPSGVHMAMLGGYLVGKTVAHEAPLDETVRAAQLDTVYDAMTTEWLSPEDQAVIMAYAGNLAVQAALAQELLQSASDVNASLAAVSPGNDRMVV